MGFLDNLRNASVEVNGVRMGNQPQLETMFPLGTVLPRRVYVQLHPRFAGDTMVAFFATVGIAPEDSYGIEAVQSNDITIGWQAYFRYRPEHEAGLARWFQPG